MARRRAVQVCSACHERKVRCDLDTIPKPCSKCREQHLECRPRTRKSYSTINRKCKPTTSITSEVNCSNTEQGKRSISQIDHSKVFESIILQPSSRTTSIYVGESGYGTLMDILGPEAPERRHITVHGNNTAVLNAEDLQYLKLKGCFNLPNESDDLLTAYFHFVHPIFPVIDGRSFLQGHADGGLENVNLLILWSMFSVSATYVPTCRGKGTKALFHMRGRLLFDLSGENDRLVLLQSALLLSFWFDDAEDVKQSWYWSGIAFDIALSLGLHGEPKSHTGQNSEPKNEVCRNMWHCCMLRDAWLSYSMGRPLRLDHANLISKPLPTIVSQFRDMELRGNRVYKDTEAEAFEKMWQSSVTAAQAVRQSLLSKLGQQTGRSVRLEDQVQVQENCESSVPLSMCGRHLRLCQNAATIAICQLSGTKGMAEPAADEVAKTASSYLLDTTIAFVPPMVVPLIMPAMLVSLSALESDEPEKRKSGASRLSTCFDLLEAIEQSFPAASMVKRLFSAAYQTVLTQPGCSPGVAIDTAP